MPFTITEICLYHSATCADSRVVKGIIFMSSPPAGDLHGGVPGPGRRSRPSGAGPSRLNFGLQVGLGVYKIVRLGVSLSFAVSCIVTA